jgi:hypothetical protein
LLGFHQHRGEKIGKKGRLEILPFNILFSPSKKHVELKAYDTSVAKAVGHDSCGVKIRLAFP